MSAEFINGLNKLCLATGKHLAGNMKLVDGSAEYEIAESISINTSRHIVKDVTGNHVVIKE